jgi:DNA repair protein SbcC/Rad50
VIPIEEVVAKLTQRYPQLEQVGETTYRGVDTYDGRPYAIRYFDLADNLEAAAAKLHEYQDELLGTSYFSSDSKADLRWNHYLYLVVSGAQREGLLKAKAIVESDREYARKFVVTETELDSLLNARLFGADKAEGLPPDALSIWTGILEQHALGFIVDQSMQVPAITRHIADGEGKPVRRPPAPPQLSAAEKAVSTEFLTSIAIRGFRKYPSRKAFDFGAVNLIVGVNGVGKTSLLEAIEYLFCGKTRRPGSMQLGTSISGVLSNSNLTLQTGTRPSPDALRGRHLAWYGKTELRTITLDDSFAKFNFMDTDAAVRLSVEKSRDRIVDDLAQLLLGAEASKALDRFERVLRQLEDDKKAVESNIAVRSVRLAEAKERIELIRNTPRASESLFLDLHSVLRLIDWVELPADKSQVDRVSEQIQSALVNVAVLKDSGASIPADLAALEVQIDALTNAKLSLDTLLEEAKLRTRDDTKVKLDLQQIAKRLEAVDALTPPVAAGVYEAYHRAHALENQIGSRPSTIASAEAAVARVPTDSAIRAAKLSATIEKWNEIVRVAFARVEAGAKAVSAFESTQNLLKSLQQRLRANAQEVIQHTGDATHCPVCRAAYSQAELQARIEHLTESISATESDRLRFEVQHLQAQHEQRASELAALRALAHYVTDSANLTLDGAIGKVAADRNELAGLVSELQSVRNTLEIQAQTGYSVERLLELAAAADLPISDVSADVIDALRMKLFDEQKSINQSLKVLESDARNASLRIAEMAQELGIEETKPDEFGRSVSERKRRMEDVRRAMGALRSQINVTDAPSPLELEARLRTAQDIVVQLRTAMARESQESEAMKQEVKRQNDASSEIEGLRVRLGRIDSAISVLNDLLAQQSDRALTDLVQRENASRIASTFAKIHAPNEFDIVMNGELSIVRRGSGKVQLDEMSSGQRAAYALSLFLAMNERLTVGPKVLIFDDPVAHVDDINTLSFLDHLRDIALTIERQIFFATADSKIAALFARKFRFLGERFKQIELSRD